MDRDSFIIYTKTNDIQKIADVETRFDTSNYELDRPLSKAKDKKLIGLMKGQLGLICWIKSKTLQLLNR